MSFAKENCQKRTVCKDKEPHWKFGGLRIVASRTNLGGGGGGGKKDEKSHQEPFGQDQVSGKVGFWGRNVYKKAQSV